jgi:hypothetical protein
VGGETQQDSKGVLENRSEEDQASGKSNIAQRDARDKPDIEDMKEIKRGSATPGIKVAATVHLRREDALPEDPVLSSQYDADGK